MVGGRKERRKEGKGRERQKGRKVERAGREVKRPGPGGGEGKRAVLGYRKAEAPPPQGPPKPAPGPRRR